MGGLMMGSLVVNLPLAMLEVCPSLAAGYSFRSLMGYCLGAKVICSRTTRAGVRAPEPAMLHPPCRRPSIRSCDA